MNKQEWLPENPHKCTCRKGQTAFNKEQKCFIFIEGGEAYVKSLIEWLERPCVEHEHPKHEYNHRECPQCWQQLK